jgi:hypothetical protein
MRRANSLWGIRERETFIKTNTAWHHVCAPTEAVSERRAQRERATEAMSEAAPRERAGPRERSRRRGDPRVVPGGGRVFKFEVPFLREVKEERGEAARRHASSFWLKDKAPRET